MTHPGSTPLTVFRTALQVWCPFFFSAFVYFISYILCCCCCQSMIQLHVMYFVIITTVLIVTGNGSLFLQHMLLGMSFVFFSSFIDGVTDTPHFRRLDISPIPCFECTDDRIDLVVENVTLSAQPLP